MLLKWLMHLHVYIIFHFVLICAFEDLSVLESNFKKLKPRSSNYIHNIVPSKWAGICEYVFELLKFELNFDNRLHIHYNLFTSTYTSNLKAKLVLSNKTISQTIMPCHALHFVVIPSSVLINNYKYNDIGIGVFKNNVVVVFQRTYNIVLENNSTNRYYKLLAIYNEFPISSIQPIPHHIFQHQLIKSEKLSSKLNEGTDYKDVVQHIYNYGKIKQNHVLEKVDLENFIKLCTWIYGQEKYSTVFTVSSNLQDYKNGKPEYESLKIELYKEIHSTSIMAKGMPCFGKSLNGDFTSDFKLLPGSSIDRFILAFTKSMQYTIQIVEPLELVYNLDIHYLLSIPINSIRRVSLESTNRNM